MKRNPILIIVLTLAAAMLACNFPNSQTGQPASTSAIPVLSPTLPATSIAEATGTAQATQTHLTEPEQTSVPDQTEAAPQGQAVEFNGVRLVIPTGQSWSISGQDVPESNDPNGPGWDIYPEHIEINLQNYTDQNEYFDPRISVYPLASYEAIDPYSAGILATLKNLLAQKPADTADLPFLPTVNAAQTFHSQMQYLDLQSGTGVRYLTQYAQMFTPITNDSLFYTFQGLSTDGKYFVAITFPVTAPFLQERYDSPLPAGGIKAPAFDDPNIAATMQNYMVAITQKINQTPPGDFNPDLTVLDALVTSLSIQIP